MNILSKYLNFSIVHLVPYLAQRIFKYDAGSALTYISHGKIDFGVLQVAIDESRIALLEFTQPIHTMDYILITPGYKKLPLSLTALYSVWNWKIWIYVASSITTLSFLTSFMIKMKYVQGNGIKVKKICKN